MDWWLCPWKILETVTSPLGTFSILKEKKINPEYNYTDMKHSGNLIEHLHCKTHYYFTMILIPSFLGTRCASVYHLYIQVATDITVYTTYNNNIILYAD
jgi:hypothetical protein